MPNIPVRGVGRSGVIPDRSPYDLPLDAWTDCRNVRYSGKTVSRYSVFKDLFPLASFSSAEDSVPVGALKFVQTDGSSRLLVVQRDNSVLSLLGSSVTDVSPAGTFPLSWDRTTSAYLAGCTFFNRASIGPFSRTPSELNFTALPNWDPADRCYSLRSYKDFLIAMNVTKGSINYPAMYKWSDAAQSGAVPSNWNVALESSLSGENVINDLRSPLIDGLGLGDDFIMYSSDEVVRLTYIDQPFIFRHDTAFADDGMIAQNCVVNVDGKHYVFGKNDLYVHDGITKESLTKDHLNEGSATSIKDYLFSTINFNFADRCFVLHNAAHSEILFCYPSMLDEVSWSGTQDANFAAVYNYASSNWSLVELPNVVAGVQTSTNEAQIWDELGGWGLEGSSWNAYSGKGSEILTLTSAGNSMLFPAQSPKVLVLDDLKSPRSNRGVFAPTYWRAYTRRIGLDLDEIGAELSGRKMLRAMFPQVSTNGPADEFLIKVGSQFYSGQDVTWSEPIRFDPRTMYKIDLRVSGRYLALEFIVPTGSYANLSGYDLDLIKIAGR